MLSYFVYVVCVCVCFLCSALSALNAVNCAGVSILNPPLPRYTIPNQIQAATYTLAASGIAVGLLAALGIVVHRGSRIIRSASTWFLMQVECARSIALSSATNLFCSFAWFF